MKRCVASNSLEPGGNGIRCKVAAVIITIILIFHRLKPRKVFIGRMGVDNSSVTGRRWVWGGVGPGASAPQWGGPLRVGPGRPAVPSLSPAMAPRGAAPILPLALALTAVAAVSWARGPSGTLWSRQGCAALGRCCPGRDPTCAARGPPRCFCDQACREVRDCCPDYARACPGAPPGARGMGGAPSAEGSRVPGCDGTRKRGSRPRRGFWTWRGARARGTGTLRTPGEEWGWKGARGERCSGGHGRRCASLGEGAEWRRMRGE